jgi:hypothetical protein
MGKNASGFALHFVKDGVLQSVLPGEDIPSGLNVTNPLLLGGKKPQADALGDGDVPPQAGAGSGRDVWADYAEQNGVDVHDDWKRDQIIAACQKAGVAVE